jgi:hypothetical protein
MLHVLLFGLCNAQHISFLEELLLWRFFCTALIVTKISLKLSSPVHLVCEKMNESVSVGQ